MQQFYVHITRFYPDRTDPVFSEITRPGPDLHFFLPDTTTLHDRTTISTWATSVLMENGMWFKRNRKLSELPGSYKMQIFQLDLQILPISTLFGDLIITEYSRASRVLLVFRENWMFSRKVTKSFWVGTKKLSKPHERTKLAQNWGYGSWNQCA